MSIEVTTDASHLNFGDKPNLRAILLPKSDSAVYSTHLEENENVFFISKDSLSLPSPDASSSEESTDDDAPKSRTHTHPRRRRDGTSAVILLESKSEKFTLGGSCDNDVVLKHPHTTNEDSCYINLFHAHIYPDPDHDSLVLFNGSTSVFCVQSLTFPHVKDNIIPGKEATLDRGCWHVSFGAGLDFEIKVLLRIVKEIPRDWTIISPRPVTSLATKRSDQVAIRSDSTKLPEDAKAGDDDKVEVEKTGEEGRTSRAHSLKLLIHKTQRTLIFKKATQEGATVAIKVCRRRTVKESAQWWKNEKDILNCLNHPSIIKLLNYDAATLSLELEYGGQDLSTFANKRTRMSELSKATAHQIWVDVSSGVEYIHSKKILHLDIKAENILLSGSRRAKICDFGFSVPNAAEPMLWDGGTPTYTPPEFLLTGKRGRPADIWDCGLVMMFVLGIWPLPPPGKWKVASIRTEGGDAATKMLEWFEKVNQSKRKIPNNYPLLRKMLDINPNRRITSLELVKSLQETTQVEALATELLL